MKLRMPILVLVIVLIGGSIFTLVVYFSNQDISQITDQYKKLENYTMELEKLIEYNQKILEDLESQLRNSDDASIEQINQEIEIIKHVINENKNELERIIEQLSEM